MPSDDRLRLARKRILSVLTTNSVANARTLEQKISDAGPFNQRIDPHVLTEARRQLQAEGYLAEIRDRDTRWYHLRLTPTDRVNARLAELKAVHDRFIQSKVTMRTGQALEIAVYRALGEQDALQFLGSFDDLDLHDDALPYRKTEPPSRISRRSIDAGKRLDFIAGDLSRPLGIEVKNVRPWVYPHDEAIRELLQKCCALRSTPVLIARRIPYITFRVFHPCGLLIHQTYNQRLASADAELAALAKRKDLLGYHDIRLGNEADDRLRRFVSLLPSLEEEARERFLASLDLLEPFSSGAMSYEEFAARVRRRELGVNEDFDEGVDSEE